MAGRSRFGRLRSPHVPGSSHAIGVCAPFTVWAVVPLLAGNNNNRKKNPYKNNRDPTCWLGPLIIGRKILTKTIGIQPVGLDP